MQNYSFSNLQYTTNKKKPDICNFNDISMEDTDTVAAKTFDYIDDDIKNFFHDYNQNKIETCSKYRKEDNTPLITHSKTEDLLNNNDVLVTYNYDKTGNILSGNIKFKNAKIINFNKNTVVTYVNSNEFNSQEILIKTIYTENNSTDYYNVDKIIIETFYDLAGNLKSLDKILYSTLPMAKVTLFFDDKNTLFKGLIEFESNTKNFEIPKNSQIGFENNKIIVTEYKNNQTITYKIGNYGVENVSYNCREILQNKTSMILDRFSGNSVKYYNSNIKDVLNRI